jgi:dephospho-CoA kinase
LTAADDPRTPTHVGLTGGIGSGKSTFGGLLLHLGAALIDADAIARAATAAQGAAIPAITSAFGPELIDPAGALDRGAMRELVYRDPTARARLEAIVHPLVGQEIQRQTRQAVGSACSLLVLDIPLLVEGGERWRAAVDRIVVVDCEVEVQIARVQARSGLEPSQIARIIAAQATREQRLAAADIVVFNGGAVTRAELASQARALMANLTRYDESQSAKAPA